MSYGNHFTNLAWKRTRPTAGSKAEIPHVTS